MKKHKNLLSTCVAIMFTQVISAQVLQPVLQWEVESAIGGGGGAGWTFMDYTDDDCMSMWVGVGAEAHVTGVNSDGTVYFVNEVAWPSGSIVGPLVNMGTTSYVHYINPVTKVITSALCTNENITEALISYSFPIPSNYGDFVFIDDIIIGYLGNELHGLLLRVFDDTDGKEKALLIAIKIDPVAQTASHTIIPIFVGSWATFPSSIVGSGNDFYVCGYFNKNAGGTNRDNFITKVHNDGEIFSVVYQKIHFSYSGRDDVAKNMVSDGDGNFYIISNSEDNVSPYYDHIAIFKINPVNGKRLWIRRLGEGTLAHEVAYDAAGNQLGDGLAVTGSISDGAGGRNGRTWRLNGSGTTMWIKTINQTGPGTIEEGREINFCMGSGDFNVMGYRNSDNNFFVARYNTTTGVGAWPLEVYNGEFAGQVVDGSMVLGSSLSSDIYCNYLVQSGLDVSMVTSKFSQVVLREGTDQIVEEDINIYPNPSADYIQISGIKNNSLIQFINMNGQVVLETQVDSANPVFDIRSLPQGCYSCLIYSGEELKTLQFIKSK